MSRQRIILFFIVIISIAAGVFSYQPIWKDISSFRPWNLGLDIAGGSYLIYNVNLTQVNSTDHQSVLNGLRDVIEKRVNLFGVSEPRVYLAKSQEQNRLIVELAGVKDVKTAIEEIGTTPFLDFREVVTGEVEQEVIDNTTANNNDQVHATTTTIQFTITELNGRYVKGAQLAIDPVDSKPVVNIQFTSEGGKIFEELTEKNIGKPIAMFLDDQLLEIATVREKISGGRAQISGDFTIEEARTLISRFNAGALPAPIKLVNQQTISPELGKDSLDKAMFAGLIGTILIIAFMILYYKKLGVFAGIALLFYIALTLAVFKIIPITLTLAGISGFLLSIGMAVDANILVFERTKEELKKGHSASTAIEEGFKRAWTSIRDSNISTIITSLALYYFTSSFVKGFALALFIGVLLSMFSAITITRTMLRVSFSDTKRNEIHNS